MAHLCVPQNQALGVCRGSVPDIQACGTHGREDLVNATVTSNREEEAFDPSLPLSTPDGKPVKSEIITKCFIMTLICRHNTCSGGFLPCEPVTFVSTSQLGLLGQLHVGDFRPVKRSGHLRSGHHRSGHHRSGHPQSFCTQQQP